MNKFPHVDVIIIMGSGAVGKTTLYNNLRKLWTDSESWILIDEAVKKNSPSISKKFIFKFINVLGINAVAKSLSGHLLIRPSNLSVRTGLRLFSRKQPVFSDCISSLISKKNMRLERVYRAINWLSNYGHASQLNTYTLVSELGDPWSSFLKAKIDVDYIIDNMPLPKAIILLEASPETLAKRQVARISKFNDFKYYINNGNSTNEMYRYFCEKAVRKNVAVIHIDTEMQSEKLVLTKSVNFIRENLV